MKNLKSRITNLLNYLFNLHHTAHRLKGKGVITSKAIILNLVTAEATSSSGQMKISYT